MARQRAHDRKSWPRRPAHEFFRYARALRPNPVLARRHVDRLDPHDRTKTIRRSSADSRAIAAHRRHSDHPRAHGPSRSAVARGAAQDRGRGRVREVREAHRAARLQRCARTQVGRDDHRQRDHHPRDGRAALGPAMASVRRRLRLQQLRAGKKRPPDAARLRQRPDRSLREPRIDAARRGRIFDRRLRSVDLQSCEPRTGLGDVPADARPLPYSYSLGHVQAVEGADARTAATTNRRRRDSAGSNCDTSNRRNLDAARVDRDASQAAGR